MRSFTPAFLLFLLFCGNTALAAQKTEIENYIDICKKDLDFLQSALKNNSANYANKKDKQFHEWYKTGYEDALNLIDAIGDKDDCHYVMKYYVNGFNQSHIAVRGYIPLPAEQYPGFLTAKKGNAIIVIYKNNSLKYIQDVKVGSKITHINGMPIDDYYKEYILPFYASDSSLITLESASVYELILDGNRFKPIARTVTLDNEGVSLELSLKYTELKGSALAAAKQVRQPDVADSFKVEMVSNGVWIRIPSFFPSRVENIYYSGMLSKIKNDLAKEDYIIFDMRGNLGGHSKWSRPIIRNLWGDEFIKSLGDKHDYNALWQKRLRVSKSNFIDFKNSYGAAAVDSYADALKKGKDFFLKKWSIFRDKENLYTNEDSSRFNAKIYVLTDSFCRSTCWTFVKELKQMPNVVHIGETTTIQSDYSFAKQSRSPSQHFDFFYPTQIRVEPKQDLGSSLVPSIVYKGDFRDEASLINWILSVTEKN
ncbi:MAG: S41 family peptidase [Rickettsiaceae bacterium]|nr:S41 family peptidase [Rickettsiaceae bacterium]